jgi:hypothetical protein
MVQLKKNLMFVMLVMSLLVASVFAGLPGNPGNIGKVGVNPNLNKGLPSKDNGYFELKSVEINNHFMQDSDIISVENGDSLNIRLELTGLKDSDNNRVKVWLDGYEHDSLLETSEIFALSAGRTVFKNLRVSLPSDMDSQKEYTLRLDVDGIVQEYSFYIV